MTSETTMIAKTLQKWHDIVDKNKSLARSAIAFESTKLKSRKAHIDSLKAPTNEEKATVSSFARRGNISGNNVSATMFPRLAGALIPSSCLPSLQSESFIFKVELIIITKNFALRLALKMRQT